MKLTHRRFLGLLNVSLILLLIVFSLAIPVPATAIEPPHWSPMTSGTTEHLTGVWGTYGSDVYAVGAGGTILHYDGTAWSPMTSGTTNFLYSVCGTYDNDVYAVGAGGTILHYDGTAWSSMTSGTQADLYSVWRTYGSAVYAVGASGTILRCTDGSTWSPMTSGVTDYLFSVWGTSSNNVYAVCGGGSVRTILHYDGSTWSPSYRNSGGLFRAIWGSSANNIFVVGDGGTILHCTDGSTWSTMTSGITESLTGVWGWGTYGSDVFAVGHSGTIRHYNGTLWNNMDFPTSSWLSGVWGADVGDPGIESNDVFAVGENGTILHYAPPAPTITSIIPAGGLPGQCPMTVIITGTNLISVNNGGFGAGITVDGEHVIQTDTQITVPICIDAGAAPGARNVWVANPGGTGTGGFTVYGTPTISSITPASGWWGQSLPVIITGTNFDGVTAVNFGTGITSTFVVNNATPITATIIIEPGAAPGARDVSVTAPGGTATLTGAFTVLPLLPPTGAGSGSSSGAGAGAPAQPVVLPTLAVQSATLSAKTVTPGTPITVTADIYNKSAVNGNKKVTLYVNGQVETTQGVAVNSGGSFKLTFNVSRSEPGDYTVYVDGVPAGSFKVELFRESDGMLIFSAVLVALAFIVGMVMLRRRQRTA
jgi:hypothetical protein